MTATSAPSRGPTPPAAPGDGAGGRPAVVPSLSDTFSSEWLKLVTARAPRRNLVLATVLGIVLPGLLALAIGASWDGWDAASRADFDPLLLPLAGQLLSAVFAVAVGVNVVGGEVSTGMIRLTLAATPRRGRVLAAKALAVALATGLAGAVSLVGMLAVTQPIFGAYDVPTVDMTTGGTWRALVGLTVLGPLFPVLAVAVALLLRSSAGAIATVVLVMFAPAILGGMLPEWWQENVVSLLPGPAADNVAIGHLVPEEAHVHPLVAALAVAGWLAVAFAATHAAWSRRDA